MVLPMKREKLLPSAWPLLARVEVEQRRRRRRTTLTLALAVAAVALVVGCLLELLR